MGLKAQRLKPVTGVQNLIGKTGEVNTILDPLGTVKVNGEIWNAESLSGKINTGEKIIVKGIKSLTLYVEQVKDS